MRKAHSENTVGPWAKQKLDALESYLIAYHKVMQNQRFKLIYIDAFAGAGWSRIRGAGQNATMSAPLFDAEQIDDEQAAAEEEFIAGSPVRALRAGRGFDQYYFFDVDPRRAELLRDLGSQYPDKTIHVQDSEANEGVQALAGRFHRSPDARGVVFLDPYGPHLHWATLEALAQTRKVDVIINFPLAMAINRLITRDGEIPEKWSEMLDACFGAREWRSLAYEEAVPDLFGPGELQKSDAAAERLLAFYQSRIKDAFGHVARPSLVRNTKGAPLYYLLWASSHGRGVPIADHIMKLGDRVRLPTATRPS